jgi:hypothetical protein
MLKQTSVSLIVAATLPLGAALAAGIGISDTGITFADASVQGTAAVPENVVLVGKLPQPSANFNSLAAALASITDASASNRYVVRIGPGVYDQGAVTVGLKAFVDVVGAGPGLTTLTSSVADDPLNALTIGTLVAANNMELRDIAVVNTATTTGIAIVSNGNDASFVLRNVSARTTHLGGSETRAIGVAFGGGSAAQWLGGDALASGAWNNNFGILISGTGTIPLIEGVNALAEGSVDTTNTTGIRVESEASPSLVRVQAQGRQASAAEVGLDVNGTNTTVTVDRSTLIGGDGGQIGDVDLQVNGNAASAQLANSLMERGAVTTSTGATAKCAFVSNTEGLLLTSTCGPPP